MAASPRYFVVPGPGLYGDVTSVLWSGKKLEDAKAFAPRGYVVRLGDRKAGSKWYPRDEAEHPVIWEKAKPSTSQAHSTKKSKKLNATDLKHARGLHVMARYQGRDLLGTIKEVRHDAAAGKARLIVHHFNGEPWPIEPMASAVKVI